MQSSKGHPMQRKVQAASTAGMQASSMANAGALLDVASELEWQPELSMQQKVTCAAASALLSCIVYAFTAPAAFNPQYAAGMGCIFAACLWLVSSVLQEQLYEARGRDVADLGDHDSHFVPVGSIRVHAKASVAARIKRTSGSGPAGHRELPSPVVAAHCYHGFGANLYSYAPVQRLLAEALQGIVTSHDAPGFGLTERPRDVRQYFLAANGVLGHAVQSWALRSTLGDDTVAQLCAPAGSVKAGSRQAADGMDRPTSPVSVLQQGGPGSSSTTTTSHPLSRASSLASSTQHDTPSPATQPRTQAAQQAAGASAMAAAGSTQGTPVCRLLVGHSLGGLCAALEALAAPDIAGLVLVAPAILMLGAPKVSYGLQQVPVPEGPATTHTNGSGGQAGGDAARVSYYTSGDAATVLNPTQQPPAPPPALARALRALASAAKAALMLATLGVLHLLRPVIVVVLRALVRSRSFWLNGLQQAYHNPQLVTPKVVDAYRLPQLVRGWEAGMFMFLVARLAHVADTTQWLASLRGTGAGAAAATAAAAAAASDGREEEDGALALRLAAACAARHMPVLIIHGVQDRLVPASNSLRLARALPNTELAVIDACGHMPQEELPRLFTDLIAGWVARRVVGQGMQGGAGGETSNFGRAAA